MKWFRKFLIFLAGIICIGGLVLLLQRPDQGPSPAVPESARKGLPAHAMPGLDTSYRPPPPEGDGGALLRPALAEMLLETTPRARRIEILEGMDGDLNEDETKALLRELSAIPPQEENSAAHSTYIHKLCNLMQRVVAARDDFADALATVAANRNLPVVYRDYACQHLRLLWRGSRDEAEDTGRPRMDAIENTFRSLLDSQPEIAAQSLLGLHELRQTSGTAAIPDSEISQLATTILGRTPSADAIPARMTAVRVLGERRIPDSSAMLREIAASPAEHALVRSSAVGSLGFIGRESDLEFLSSLSVDDPVVSGALRHATGNR